MGNNRTATGCWGFGARAFYSVAVAIVALGVQQSAQGQQDPGRFGKAKKRILESMYDDDETSKTSDLSGAVDESAGALSLKLYAPPAK